MIHAVDVDTREPRPDGRHSQQAEVPYRIVLEFGGAASGKIEIIGSCGEVNLLIEQPVGHRPPAVDLSHRDLSGRTPPVRAVLWAEGDRRKS